MFLPEWREFRSVLCPAGNKFMIARASTLLKSRASLTCFLACFLPGGDKDLSGSRYNVDDDNNAWVLADVCEQLLARFRLGEKRAWKPKRVVQGAKNEPVSKRTWYEIGERTVHQRI